MAIIGQTSGGLSSIGQNLATTSFNTDMKYGNGNGTTLFNTDGSIPPATSRYKDNKGFINNDQWSGNNQGGKNMANLGMWKVEGTGSVGTVVDTNATQGQQPLLGGTQQAGSTTSPLAQYMSGSQPTNTVMPNVQTGTTNPNVNWGDSVNIANQANTYVAPGQIDKVNPAKVAIGKLAGKLLKLSQELNDEEFNELVKIFDLADLKDDFVQRSGRQNSYLDRQLLVEALNQCNMVFSENTTKNANLQNQLQQMATTLNNTGVYDAANVYNFMLEAVTSSAIPMNIGNDPARQHLARVIQMAVNYKNKGNNVGGINWNTQNNNSNNGFGLWGGTQNNQGGLWNTGSNMMGGSIWNTGSQQNNQGGLNNMFSNWNTQPVNNQVNTGDAWANSLNMLSQGTFNQPQGFNNMQLPAYNNSALNQVYNPAPANNSFIQSPGASVGGNNGGFNTGFNTGFNNGFGNTQNNNQGQAGFGFNTNNQGSGVGNAGFNWASLSNGNQSQQVNGGVAAGNGVLTANGFVC